MTKISKEKNQKSKGEETKHKMLLTALKMFALNGYNGVSLRSFAAEAGVNLATVGYHFGGKGGLYKALLEALIKAKNKSFPTIEEVAPLVEKTNAKEMKRSELVEWFVRRLIDGILGAPNSVYVTTIIARELQTPSEYYSLLNEEFFGPSFVVFDELLKAAMSEEVEFEERAIVGVSILGIVMRFLHARAFCERVEWEEIDAEKIDILAKVLCKRVVAFVGCED